MLRSESRRHRTSLVPVLLGTVGLAAGSPLVAQGDAPPPAAGEARVAWRHAPPGCSFEDLATDGKTLFVLDRRGFVRALDPASGDVKWISKEKIGCSFTFGLALSPAADFDAVLVGCDEGLVALKRASGERLWRTDVKGGVAGPACTERAVFAGGSDGEVHAFDLRTGAELWHSDCIADRPADPPGFAGDQARFDGMAARMGKATTDGRMVLVPIFDQSRAVAVDAATGKRLWDFRTQGWTYGGVAIGAHNAMVVSQDGNVYGVDKEMGKEMWRVTTKGRNEAPVLPTGRFLFFGSCDGDLRGVDEVVGRVVWKFAIEPDARGSTPIYGAPVVLGDTVVLAAMPGVVYAVSAHDGSLRWKLRPSPKSELNGDLVAIGRRLFVTTRKNGKDGESGVFAIDPP